MLMAIVKEDSKCLSARYLPGPGVLTSKVRQLRPDSVVHAVCREMASLNRTHIESFDGVTVLSLIKKCSKVYSPKSPRTKKLTRNQLLHQFQTKLIKRRRENGDL